MSLPEHDEIDPEYRFDLARIFPAPADWEECRGQLETDIDDLEATADAQLSNADDLRTLLATVEDCYRRKQRLELYAKLAENIRQGDDAAMDRLRAFGNVESRLETAASSVRRRLAETEAADDLFDELDEYRRYAENFVEQARHVRPPDVETTLTAHASVRRTSDELFDAVWQDLEPPTVERPGGGAVEIRRGNYRSELSHGDREYRRRVYDAYRRELDRFEHTLTEAYSTKLRAANAVVEVRRYDSIRDRDLRQRCYPESGLKSAFPESVHDIMVATIRKNLRPYHRALEVRRNCLDVDTLRPWDLEASIQDADPPRIEYETAKALVLNALEPLGADYVDRVRSLFDERRIDVFPAERKSEIPAYCPSSAEDGPFVLANFREDFRTMFFLCHELGHAMHVEHHREGPVRYATCPRPVEEVPSVLHELLLAEYLRSDEGPLAAAARNRLLECVGGNLYGSTMDSAFVLRLAERVQDSDGITPGDARREWETLQSEFMAPVEFDDRAGRNWLGRGERDIYSNYQYVLGTTGALVVRDGLREGELTVNEYRDFLRSTGLKRSVTLFERLGCDVRSPDPYERAADAFASLVGDLERTV